MTLTEAREIQTEQQSTLQAAHELLNKIKDRLALAREHSTRLLDEPWFKTKLGKTILFTNATFMLIGLAGCTIQAKETGSENTEYKLEILVEYPNLDSKTYEMPEDRSEWRYLYQNYEVKQGESWNKIIDNVYKARYSHIPQIDYNYAQKVLRIENGMPIDDTLPVGTMIDIPALYTYEQGMAQSMYELKEPLYVRPGNEATPTTSPAYQATQQAQGN